MDRTRTYNANRTNIYFRGELVKFIKVAENHTRNEKTWLIHCPSRICMNLKVFSDPTIIRSPVMVSDFVKGYMTWKYHSKTSAPTPMNNPLDEIIQDDRRFGAYDDFDDGGKDDDGIGVFHGDDVDDGPINGESSDEEIDDGDFLCQLLRNTEAEVLVANATGLPNFDTVRKSVEENIYERSKGCPKQWTVLRFVIELLIVDAYQRHHWKPAMASTDVNGAAGISWATNKSASARSTAVVFYPRVTRGVIYISAGKAAVYRI